MTVLYFIAAAGFLTLGHLLKALRWHQFTRLYEDTPLSVLMGALASGYLVSFFLPFRLGDLLRIFLAGRRMKNGCGYAMATVLVDRVLDLISVAVIFFCMTAASGFADYREAASFYAAVSAGLALLLLLVYVGRQTAKRVVLAVSSVFAEGIRFHILLFFWALITSVKDMWRRISKGRMVATTVCMWLSYLLSYGFIGGILLGSVSMERTGYVFDVIFSQTSLLRPTFFVLTPFFTFNTELLIIAVILLPLPLFLLYAAAAGRRSQGAEAETVLLPQRDTGDKLQFLNLYFEGDELGMLGEFLQMNRDVSIVRDMTAGSDATTMLCLRPEGLVYRKYAFGESAEKLMKQAEWIRRFSGRLLLPRILEEKRGENSFSYDMPAEDAAIGMFEFIYSRPVEQSWSLLRTILGDLENDLYLPPGGPLAAADIEKYIRDKVDKNLELIRRSGPLRPLLQEVLRINGKEYPGLPRVARLLEKERLAGIFSGDRTAEIHGDLTIENIVAYTDREGYYLIDPNPECPVLTPGLDYAKLLQSLHGQYEIIRYANNVAIGDGTVSFFMPQSERYEQVYRCFDAWLRERFTPEEVRSVYFHEMIHWLRLLPYKIKKNDRNLAVYFARFILLMNDVSRMFGDTP